MTNNSQKIHKRSEGYAYQTPVSGLMRGSRDLIEKIGRTWTCTK